MMGMWRGNKWKDKFQTPVNCSTYISLGVIELLAGVLMCCTSLHFWGLNTEHRHAVDTVYKRHLTGHCQNNTYTHTHTYPSTDSPGPKQSNSRIAWAPLHWLNVFTGSYKDWMHADTRTYYVFTGLRTGCGSTQTDSQTHKRSVSIWLVPQAMSSLGLHQIAGYL